MRILTRRLVSIAVAGVALARTATAQLPQVQLPPVSVPGLPGVDEMLPQTERKIDGTARTLSGARALRIARLARDHRAELDRDNRGELVVRAEVVAINLADAALGRARDAGFLLKRTQELPDFGILITVLQTPQGWSATRGLRRLRKLDPAGVYDYNHVYLDSGIAQGDSPLAPAAPAAPAPGRVGLIDGGIDGTHERFAGAQIRRFGCEGRTVVSTHGTAVASVLMSVGTVDQIYAADVYCGSPTGGAVDNVAASLGWLARERVAVINISLVGPRNALLERVVNTLVARGYLIVAAVGNDGPAAPPLFPAAYDGVVGVTAIDRKHRVLVEACRGRQVDFAARGADLEAAQQGPDQYGAVRGTSFAAPLVAALMAADLPAPEVPQRDRVVARWTAAAHDLGEPGRDDIYGAGELGPVTR